MNKFQSYIYPLVIIGVLFFVFGFLTWINGILIPYFQICLELNNFQASLVAFSSYTAYFVMAIPSAYILRFTGYKKGMVLGLFIMAAGTALFIPAANSRIYAVFLTGLFITGSGLALLQTAANPYVAIIGPIESTAQRIGFMGLANKVAGILSITIFGSIFLFNADEIIQKLNLADAAQKAEMLDSYALRIVEPYSIITVLLLLLSVMIYFSRIPEINEIREDINNFAVDKQQADSSVFQYPYLVLGVISLFFAGACEVIPIDGLIIYSRSLGIPIEEARHYSTYTMYAMLLGYLSSVILIPKVFSQQQALKYCAILGLGLTLGAFVTEGLVSAVFLMLMGFGAAMLWGTIWGLSLKGLGKHTKIGSAMLLMSVIGGGIFPVFFGKLIDISPSYPQSAVLLLLPCYLMLLFFSVYGHRIRRWSGIL
ncbi:MAG: glucose/galactose MFS transporter [Chitinophagaceae bacterium]|nr:glucose/galactose MFS transporter [Chitinophagaceae bacterium]